MDTGSLDDILNGVEAEQPTEPVAEAPPAEVAQDERPRDEHGRFAPKGEKPAEQPEASAPPAPENDDSPTVPRKALQDERAKRQSLEAELAAFRQQQAPQAPPAEAQAPQEMPDPWEDPQGYAQWVFQNASTQAQQQAAHAFHINRVAQAAEAAKLRHEDYADKVAVFQQMINENPSLEAQMLAQADPAEWAYQQASERTLLQEHGGSVSALLAAERQKWEAEALAGPKPTSAAPTAPPTISNERNVGVRTGPAWSGPASLADILR